MPGESNGSLERLIAVAEGEATMTVDEFEEILTDLETQKKYSVESYNMFCTSENVVVVCDMDTEEFVQIEIPMEEHDTDEVIVTRDV
jgi:hypothetical protein